MKKILKISLVLLLLILFTPQICKAVLQVQIVETPTSKAAALKATYGVTKYYDCRSEYSNSYCDSHGLSDPGTQMTCEQMIGYCLERNTVNTISTNNSDPTQLNSRCVTKYGSQSYSKGKDSSGTNICGCKEGYKFYNAQCISLTDSCKKTYGDYSYSKGKDSSGVNQCSCQTGYVLDYFNKCSQGIPKNVTQGALNLINGDDTGTTNANSDFLSSTPCVKKLGLLHWTYTEELGCVCDNGYELNSSKDGCVEKIVLAEQSVKLDVNGCDANSQVYRDNKCITRDQDCKNTYKNSFAVASTDPQYNYMCNCVGGYEWNQDRTSCIIISQPIVTNLIKNPKVDLTFAKKQIGKILLQVESKGEAWYVDPKDGAMHYMADGNKAYDVMRNLGVGITNKNLERIQTNKTFAKKNAGKIFLQVEANGEAYYIDFDGIAHYLKDGTAAYDIMRSLGLGITNDNLNKIPKGSL